MKTFGRGGKEEGEWKLTRREETWVTDAGRREKPREWGFEATRGIM
jgi:hypothetical protein